MTKMKPKKASASRKKRRPAKSGTGGFGQAVLSNLRESERDRRFWASVRRKVVVARRQLAEGKVLDGEAAMAQLIAETQATDPDAPAPSRRKRKSALRPRR